MKGGTVTFRDIPDLALEDLDRDGAIRVAHHRLPRSSRKGFLQAAGGGIAAVVALGRPPTATAALARGDVDILNYALTLEYLQDAFYTEAERKGALAGPAARLTRVVGAVERAHVKALRGVLGRKAVARPFFDFRGVTEDPPSFIRTAVAFDDPLAPPPTRVRRTRSSRRRCWLPPSASTRWRRVMQPGSGTSPAAVPP